LYILLKYCITLFQCVLTFFSLHLLITLLPSPTHAFVYAMY
jgi:hypothetical protein